MTPPTLVFLHHFGGSARSWDVVIAQLGGRFETLAIDLPGFGDAADDEGPFTLAAMADYVVARLQRLSATPFILVGHSMGGKVALAIAARRPAGLQALVLLAPSPPTAEPIAEDQRAALIAGWAKYDIASETLAGATARPLSPDQTQRAIDDMMRAGKAAWTAWLAARSREDISADMAAIDVPAVILSGTCDSILPTELIRQEVTGRLRDAKLLTVARVGHLLPLEAPAIVAQAIARFITDMTAIRADDRNAA